MLALRSAGGTQKGSTAMLSYLLDPVYLAVGVAAFVVTALYLEACANL